MSDFLSMAPDGKSYGCLTGDSDASTEWDFSDLDSVTKESVLFIHKTIY